MKIRKQVYQLTLDDLSKFPTWEFALDEESEEGQDEATVRPYEAFGLLDPSAGMFVVRAVFTLADGSKLKGYLTPSIEGTSDLGTLQPIIVTERGQVGFWCGVAAPNPTRLARSYETLGRAAGKVFPVHFESEVKLLGGKVMGTVPGFLVLEDSRTKKTRIVT